MRKGQCRLCGATDLEVVFLVEGSIKYPRQRRWHPERFTICPDCHGRGPTPASEWYTNHVRWTLMPGRGEQMEPTPCAVCGIHVIRNADPLLKRVTCSHACTTSLTRIRNGNKGSGRPCESCGEPITTGRADSRYCGSACRQKAYRRRAAAPRPEAPPLMTAAGRRWPQRSQRTALQSGMATLSGLCGAFAGVGALEGPAKPSELAHWRTELADAEQVVQTLHRKLQARSGVTDSPVDASPKASLPTRRKHLATGTAALSGLCSGLASVKELTEDITPEQAAQWQTQAAEALAGIRNIRRVLDARSHP